ncbi:unnamed protein product [Angiostrongylus costaricensis]|uniref:ABC transmembrane type-1 domain-containing protein n=1 Tax=Angiostrongylus costaricensis TaxID=334426 RepID=A0A0R3PZ15_ANGCS|nr:unnamed protein product [Angiostrongylus costaricensis]
MNLVFSFSQRLSFATQKYINSSSVSRGFIAHHLLEKHISMLSPFIRHYYQKYQATENLRVLQLFGPLLVLHFIAYPTYFGVSVLVQSIKNIVGNENFRLIYSILYVSGNFINF